MASDDITEGLQQIGQFSTDHPEEILILDIQHLAAPGEHCLLQTKVQEEMVCDCDLPRRISFDL